MRRRKGLTSSGETKKTSVSMPLTNLVQLARHQQQIVLSSIEHSAAIHPTLLGSTKLTRIHQITQLPWYNHTWNSTPGHDACSSFTSSDSST